MIVTEANLVKVAIKYSGNKNKVAKELGITNQAVNKRLKENPHLSDAVNNAKQAALIEAGLTRPAIYKVIKEGLEATTVIISDGEAKLTNVPDYKERRESAKLAMQASGDLESDKLQVNNFNLSMDERVAIAERMALIMASRV